MLIPSTRAGAASPEHRFSQLQWWELLLATKEGIERVRRAEKPVYCRPALSRQPEGLGSRPLSLPLPNPGFPALWMYQKYKGEKPQLVNGPQMWSSTQRLGACAGEGLLPRRKEAQDVGGARRHWRAVGSGRHLGIKGRASPLATGQHPPLRQNAQRQRLGGVGRARGPPRLHSPMGAPRPSKQSG